MFQLQSFVPGQGHEQGGYRIAQIPQAEDLSLDLHLARLNPGKIQNVREQIGQASGGIARGLHILLLLLIQLG